MDKRTDRSTASCSIPQDSGITSDSGRWCAVQQRTTRVTSAVHCRVARAFNVRQINRPAQPYAAAGSVARGRQSGGSAVSGDRRATGHVVGHVTRRRRRRGCRRPNSVYTCRSARRGCGVNASRRCRTRTPPGGT